MISYRWRRWTAATMTTTRLLVITLSIGLAAPTIAFARPPRFWQCVTRTQEGLLPALGASVARRKAVALCQGLYDRDRASYGGVAGLRLAPRTRPAGRR